VRRPDSPPSAADYAEVAIERIGAEGDGVATLPDGEHVHIPLTLPGEQVLVETRTRSFAKACEAPPATPVAFAPATAGGDDGASPAAIGPAILRASPDRVTPPCQHFGTCGGCTLQHWRDDGYATWKSGLLRDALRRAGYPEPPIGPLARSAPLQRRRMDFAARRTPRGVLLGLHMRARPSSANRGPDATRASARAGERRAAPVTDLADCRVLHATLFALLAPLRAILLRLHALRREASVVANLLDHGPDLLLRTDAPLDRADRDLLVGFARDHRLARISWARGSAEPEAVAILQPPCITLSNIPVDLPPGGFLQATSAGEAAIIEAVLAGLPPRLPRRARIAEFYAGSGSLTFALARRSRVMAWEGDAAAAAALRQAANKAGVAGGVTVVRRDLARQPVMAAELAGFAAAVLDPPFAGAAAQTAQIAAAKVPAVVYVSCNPAVLARDARLLRDAGYTLSAATPVDQFLWSARLESVCVFQR